MKHQLRAIDGQRKAVAEFNPFFPDLALRRECNRQVETHHWLHDVAGIVALLAFFTALGMWMGVL